MKSGSIILLLSYNEPQSTIREDSLHVLPCDFGVTENFPTKDNEVPVAKFIYARILFYEDNRNQFSFEGSI